MPRQSIQLELTVQERAALSIALRTLLNLWGDSEDAKQERVHAKLRRIAEKLKSLDSERPHAVSERNNKSIAQGTVRQGVERISLR
jgi:hypothetical protein